VEVASRTEKGQRQARYALAISISAPDLDVDLYTEVTAEIEARIAAEVILPGARCLRAH